MTIKYAKKAQLIFGKKQALEGHPILAAAAPAWVAETAYDVGDAVLNGGNNYICTVAGTSAAAGGPTGTANTAVTDGTATWIYTTVLGATDAIAVFSPDFSNSISSETAEYSGDELERDSDTTITDKFSELSAETFVHAMGVVVGAPTAANFPVNALFTSAGAAAVYSGTGATAEAKFGNDIASNDLMTIAIAKGSASRATKQKVYRFYDCRTTVDLEVKSSTRARFKWNFKGTPCDALGQAFPQEIDKITPDFSTQKTIVAPPVRLAQLRQAQIVVWNSKAFNTGTTDLPTEFTSTTKNICFSRLNAPNLFGFDYGRFLTGCEEGFDKQAVGTDVTLTLVEEAPDATWNPDGVYASGGNGLLEGYFAIALQWGTVQGQKVYLEFTKLQCVDVKNSDIGNYSGKDVVFKNTGKTILRFR